MAEQAVEASGVQWVTPRTDGGFQVARVGDEVWIRDPARVISKFTIPEWHAFLAGLRLGDFDGIA